MEARAVDLEIGRLGFKFINWHLCQARRPCLHLWNGALHRLCSSPLPPIHRLHLNYYHELFEKIHRDKTYYKFSAAF